ncbi:HAD-IC family P-type ATPase [Candidatus Nitrosocosmicus arcticus]|uniref:Potassium-transporting ATPase ATP-binding subunit n=1 Tax=Candidatus Nitrosocosmicus arcticus TaxID=2035267 RepID=A0A557SWA5_9ARCH|nr:HAD-IC family P-type ATPase [Candidatus Nitrosocosmicus arcticus]TVP40880.1 High-affinity K+ transport system, ATPase chain B [Candidatus Nitrosocosmicus arcticus]
MNISKSKNKERKNNNGKNNNHTSSIVSAINTKVILDSIKKLDPRYLAKNNPVMFTVELGFLVVLFVAMFPNISEAFVSQSQVFYIGAAIILILTVWFATFSESLSEAQARARVDSLKKLEKEVTARKLEHGKEVVIKSSHLKPGDEVKVYAGELIPRDGLVIRGKTFIDESMMTGESNPVFKEKDDHVIGGTIVTSDSLIVEITAEAGKSYLDEMVGLIENATRPKTQNEIALTILLAGLSIIFITVIGTLLFSAYYLGYNIDIATLVALLVALMPTTIGGLLPAIGVAGITRLGKYKIIAKSGKGIEAAGDCDILILDKTGTITEGSRSAIEFIPMEKYTEEDVGQVAYAASIQDNTHEGKSIVDLSEERKYLPPMLEKMISARSIEFTAETRVSGIEFIPNKIAKLDKNDEEELRNLAKTVTSQQEAESSTLENLEDVIDRSSHGKIHDMLLDMEKNSYANPVRILKGSVDVIIELAKSNPSVNAAELKWKAQEVSKKGETPLAIAINDEVIGLVVLKDNLKENIRQKLDEVHAAGITTIMITGDNQITAQVIAQEANVNQVMAEAKPTDKLQRVLEEQQKGHIIGMVGDGTNDAPALAKADIGLAMNSGTAAAKEAANMVDLDSDPSKILKVVKLGKQLLMTRGAITTFSIANDAAKYFAILPSMFAEDNPKLAALNLMQLHSPDTAILSTLIFNAITIPALIPLSLRGIKFKAEQTQQLFVRNILIYGLGGAALPFIGIKAIDMLLSTLMR